MITNRRRFLKATLLAGLTGISFTPNAQSTKRKLKPKIVGNWWRIGPPPPISNELPAETPKSQEDIKKICEAFGMSVEDCLKYSQKETGKISKFEPVDHHIFKASDGQWHLWGCVRGTGYGRILYHWKAKNLTDTPWELTGEMIRCDPSVGECIDDWRGQEWIQSPYIVDHEGKYYMFYGGHSTGRSASGTPAGGMTKDMFFSESQICLMVSEDGLKWERHLFKDGFSRLFTGPGEARDPCVVRIGDTWHLYYAGYENGDQPKQGGFFVRTSKNLINWSSYKLVHRDPTFGSTSWAHECPHVVYRDGYFYLFRTENYYLAKTHVYRSEDPMDFGTNATLAQKKYVGPIACAAPEIYKVDGHEYVSSNHEPAGGTMMCRLTWEDG
jgi:hypothetical protein